MVNGFEDACKNQILCWQSEEAGGGKGVKTPLRISRARTHHAVCAAAVLQHKYMSVTDAVT